MNPRVTMPAHHWAEQLDDSIRALLVPQDSFVGTPNDDTLTGTAGNDRISGRKGDDSIDGAAGDDSLDGGAGTDRLEGGAGSDTIAGGGGNDLMTDQDYALFIDAQGDGVDTIIGGEARYDRLEADWSTATKKIVWTVDAATAEVVNGNLISGVETVVIHSGSGNDRYVVEGGGSSKIWGGAGADKISIDPNNSQVSGYIYGEDGNDTISAGDGVSSDGGAGNDLMRVDSFQTTHHGGEGNDTIYAEGRFVGSFGGTGDDYISVGDDDCNLGGEDGNDTLLGGAGDNSLGGGAGDDWLNAGGGFADTMRGGDGNDTLVSSASGTHLMLEGDAGADLFRIESGSYLSRIDDMTSGEDHIGISVAVFAPGDGDTVVEGAIAVQGPGGFSSGAELVIVRQDISNILDKAQVAAAIGSATGNYAVGQCVMFVVDDGGESVIYNFRSADANAVVSASELGGVLCTTTETETSVGDYLFV